MSKLLTKREAALLNHINWLYSKSMRVGLTNEIKEEIEQTRKKLRNERE